MANECEMDPKAKAVLDEWCGGEGKYELLHRWSDNGIYYICTRRNGLLFFLRVFLLAEKWVVSQDKGYVE